MRSTWPARRPRRSPPQATWATTSASTSEGERLVTHRLRLPRPGLPRLALGGHASPGRPARPLVTVDEAVLLPGDDALLRPRLGAVERAARPRRPRGRRPAADRSRRRPPRARLGRRRCRWTPPTYAPRTTTPTGWRSGSSASGRPGCCRRSAATTRPTAGTPASTGRPRPIAVAAPAQCSTCGFFLPLAGSLRRVFGVCANDYSPSDGTVVSVDHGCGAHSEVAALPSPVEVTPPLRRRPGLRGRHPGRRDGHRGRRAPTARGRRSRRSRGRRCRRHCRPARRRRPPRARRRRGPRSLLTPRARTSWPRSRTARTPSAPRRCAPACSRLGGVTGAVPRGRQRRGRPGARRLPRPRRRRARAERRRRRRPRRRPGRLLLLTLDGTALVASNTGAPLDAAGVESLSTLRASAKRDDDERSTAAGSASASRRCWPSPTSRGWPRRPARCAGTWPRPATRSTRVESLRCRAGPPQRPACRCCGCRCPSADPPPDGCHDVGRAAAARRRGRRARPAAARRGRRRTAARAAGPRRDRGRGTAGRRRVVSAEGTLAGRTPGRARSTRTCWPTGRSRSATGRAGR